MTFLELLVKTDENFPCYNYSLPKEGLAIIEVTRKDGHEIGNTDIMFISGLREAFYTLYNEQYIGEWRHDNYHYGLYCVNRNEDACKALYDSWKSFLNSI